MPAFLRMKQSDETYLVLLLFKMSYKVLDSQALYQHEARTFIRPVCYGNRSSITHLYPQSKCIPGANIRPVVPCNHYVPHSNLKLCYLQHTNILKRQRKTFHLVGSSSYKTHTRCRMHGTTAHYKVSNTNIRPSQIMVMSRNLRRNQTYAPNSRGNHISTRLLHK